MGKNLKTADPRGWLRKVPSPEGCRRIKRVNYNEHFTVIFTEESRIFICGKGFSGVIKLLDGA